MGPVAIVVDSIMLAIREELLKTDKHNVKVRFYRGGTIEDVKDYIKPENRIISFLMSEPNQQRNKFDDPRYIWQTLTIKKKIVDALKSCKVIISQPTLRSHNEKAALTNHRLCNLLEELNIDIFKNRNIASKHLGGKGLHLNPHGTSKLALHFKGNYNLILVI